MVQGLLADARTDVNKANNAGFTPIASAANNGHLSVVNALLADPRTDVNVRGGITPLTAAAAQGQLDIVQAFVMRSGFTFRRLDGTTVRGRARSDPC